MKTIPYIIILCALVCSCGSTKKGASSEPEFFSGSFTVGEDGQATFTDCSTRITMRIGSGGRYEQLRRRYSESSADPSAPVRIEFHGTITEGIDRTATAHGSNPVPTGELPVVRVDSLLTLDSTADCLTDYQIPGLYRSEKDGQVRILRLKPLYTYSLEVLDPSNSTVLAEGRWYRTSLVTIMLEDKNSGEAVPFQIIPVRDAISRMDGDEAEVYTKEWL